MSNSKKQLTAASHNLFMEYADDAKNWGGRPFLNEGNIEITKEQRGNITDLLKKGFIFICGTEDGDLLAFTEKGIAYAAKQGVEIIDDYDC